MSHASDPLKTKFLLTALPDVPFDGWTEALMERTAKKLKLSGKKLDQAFPVGAKDLVVFFFEWATAETLRQMKKTDLESLRVRDRITLGVRTQLEILQPYKQAVSAAMAFLAVPPRSLLLPKLLWRGADKLWWAAGDTATDYNHYTKRALLSGVLSSTTLYWLNDTSKDHAPTWAFLDRRIENVLKIGQKISSFKKRKES
ncbi:MAG: COQ9 family protein [Alphaproteobacteria bacterium]|nr:COQ9 family protein [Alphaproteobacteria bacterium]